MLHTTFYIPWTLPMGLELRKSLMLFLSSKVLSLLVFCSDHAMLYTVHFSQFIVGSSVTTIKVAANAFVLSLFVHKKQQLNSKGFTMIDAAAATVIALKMVVAKLATNLDLKMAPWIANLEPKMAPAPP